MCESRFILFKFCLDFVCVCGGGVLYVYGVWYLYGYTFMHICEHTCMIICIEARG